VVVVLGDGLAYHPGTGEWWTLGNTAGNGNWRRGAVTLWAGDRLMVWGGQDYGDGSEMYPVGYMLIPEW